jgi:hypothetical protein
MSSHKSGPPEEACIVTDTPSDIVVLENVMLGQSRARNEVETEETLGSQLHSLTSGCSGTTTSMEKRQRMEEQTHSIPLEGGSKVQALGHSQKTYAASVPRSSGSHVGGRNHLKHGEQSLLPL